MIHSLRKYSLTYRGIIMAGSPTSTTRKRRTKAEIQKEFELLSEDVRQAVDQVIPSEEKANELRDTQILARTEQVTAEIVVQNMASLGLEVSKVLAGLSEKITTEVRLLSELREAVDLQKQELSRTHKIDIAGCALEQLIEDYDQKKQEFEKEYDQKKQAVEQELTELQNELDKQQQTHETEAKEYEATLKKTRQREVEEYEYKKALERKKAQDKYEEEQRTLERVNSEKQSDFEKNWQTRENNLKSCEEELSQLRKESATFQERLKKETDRAVVEALKAQEHTFAHETTLLKRDMATENRLSELKIKTLEEVNVKQLQQIESLQKRIEEAKQQVENIALKAIDGASNLRALDRVNAIAMEQAKTRTSGNS